MMVVFTGGTPYLCSFLVQFPRFGTKSTGCQLEKTGEGEED